MGIDDTIEIASRYSMWEVFLLVVALVVIIVTVFEFFKKVYGVMEEWRTKKNTEENKDVDIARRVEALERADVEMGNKLDNISAGVQQLAASMDTMSESINKRLDEMTEDQRKTAVNTTRSILYELHSEFIAQQYVTLAQRETFEALKETYLSHGGNSIFKSKIIPEIDSLPIKG